MESQANLSTLWGKTIVVIGAGGNIGSHLMPHLVRIPGVTEITCVDRDVYEKKNLSSQDISPRDVGKSKAAVQARRLRRINPELNVRYINDAVENIPLGRLRANLILACLDSKGARRYINQVAWRLNVPFVDAGVAPDNLLARVNVYLPGADSACLECGLNDEDYAAIEQVYPCQPGDNAASSDSFPTNAPSSLGALAASLQAIEAMKLLHEQLHCAAVGREVLLNAQTHMHFVTRICRRSDCRFDHESWTVEKLQRHPKAISIGDALALKSGCEGENQPWALGVERNPFVTKLSCLHCDKTRKVLRLQNRLSQRERTCGCGRLMMAAAFDRLEYIEKKILSRAALDRSLASIGLRPGDIFTLAIATRQTHYELKG